jgi:hypothetical protein
MTTRRIFLVLALVFLAPSARLFLRSLKVASLANEDVLALLPPLKESAQSSKKSTVSLQDVSQYLGQLSTLQPIPPAAESTKDKMSVAKQNKGYLYYCGETPKNLGKQLFPEYFRGDFKPGGSITFTERDVLFFTFGCSVTPTWVQDNFPGKALFMNGESTNPHGQQRNVVQIGHLADDGVSAVRVSFGIMILVGMWHPQHTHLFLENSRGPFKKQKNFMIYAQSHCVGYRERAATLLSEINSVHFGGQCRGRPYTSNIIKADIGHQQDWGKTPKMYDGYRFCLVMENRKLDGYITEKIFLAFVGGCIPIYYGANQIFDIFNKLSFVYFDIDKPTEAIMQIRHLEENETAYLEMWNYPILANGNKTLEDFFSLTDDIGHGKLKQKIRQVMGLES